MRATTATSKCAVSDSLGIAQAASAEAGEQILSMYLVLQSNLQAGLIAALRGGLITQIKLYD